VTACAVGGVLYGRRSGRFNGVRCAALKAGSGIEDSDVLSMFPTLVWKAKLKEELYQRINRTILERLDQLRASQPPLRPGSGWQSGQDLHTMEGFDELVQAVNTMAERILEFLKIGYERFEITACWANALAPGASHKIHAHPNNYLSGIYYVSTFDSANTVNFHDPRPQTGVVRPPVTELTGGNTDQVVVQVEDGTMLFFPAWLEHSVDANQSKQERISVSFNVMFSSFTETMSKPLW
jgi:uncharacterized protein (TIGR02466 family)